MRVAVVGAAGATGSVVAGDLADDCELVLLDLARAEGVNPVDAADPQAVLLAIEGCDVVVNAAPARVALAVMDAAVAAGATYVDAGGPDDVVAKQRARDGELRERGVVAVLGCAAGAAPDVKGCTAAAVARLVGRGALAGKAGCLTLEAALDLDLLAAELEARGCTFETRGETA